MPGVSLELLPPVKREEHTSSGGADPCPANGSIASMGMKPKHSEPAKDDPLGCLHGKANGQS